MGKWLQSKQYRWRTVIVLDLGAVRGAEPVGFAAGENEGRLARCGKFCEHAIDRAAKFGGGYFVEAVDDYPLGWREQLLRPGSAD